MSDQPSRTPRQPSAEEIVERLSDDQLRAVVLDLITMAESCGQAGGRSWAGLALRIAEESNAQEWAGWDARAYAAHLALRRAAFMWAQGR